MKIEDHEVFKIIAARLNRGDFDVVHRIQDWDDRIQINFKFGFGKYFRFEIRGIRYMSEDSVKLGRMDSYLKPGFLLPRQYVDPKEISRDITTAIRHLMIARINNDEQVRADGRAARINEGLSKL